MQNGIAKVKFSQDYKTILEWNKEVKKSTDISGKKNWQIDKIHIDNEKGKIDEVGHD